MNGRQRTVVPSVHCLQHVEGLCTADLAHDDSIRPHAQTVTHEIPDGDFASSFCVGGPRLESDEVRKVKAELHRIFDGDDPFGATDVRRQNIEHGGLTGAGTTTHNDVHAPLHCRL